MEFVRRSIAALGEHGNTISTAPTGAGKTICLSAVIGNTHQTGDCHLVLQHRDELVAQNSATFSTMNPKIKHCAIDAKHKDWQLNGVNFAMVQTLIRNLDTMPVLSGITIDEAHHTAADSYLRIINKAKLDNPDVKIFGVTATPNRGDKKALRGVFTNCADQITITELIESGHLVPPRTYVVDIGVQEDLSRVHRSALDFDMAEVEEIMDKVVLNDRIVDEWKAKAGDRQTVVFCSTVLHAQHVKDAFVAHGVHAETIYGDMPKGDREHILADYDAGKIDVLTNVAVLTEGWDHQPTGCIVLLRPSSFKSTMIQMIGRGLRKVDPERYPGVQKDDCIVLDFGTSLLIHGNIKQDVRLDGEGLKDCPECSASVPKQCTECPICGFEWPKIEGEKKVCQECGEENPVNARLCWNCNEPFSDQEEKVAINRFQMTEVDILDASPYKWTPLFEGLVLVASAFDAWAMVVKYNDRFYAVGGAKNHRCVLLGDNNDRQRSLTSADDYLRQHGDKEMASKSKRWLSLPATNKQLNLLGIPPMQGLGINRYSAACRLTWKFQEKGVRAKLEGTHRKEAA